MCAPKRILAGLAAEGGFTVAEFVIAAGILFFVSVSMIGALMFSSAGASSAAHREAALNLANQRLEWARNIAYDSLGVVGGDPPGLIQPEYTSGLYKVATSVGWARDAQSGRATYKKIVVSVTWQKPVPGSVSVETAVFGKSALTNSGDVIVQCLSADDGSPIVGANVSVTTAGGTARTSASDSAGEAFFGYVPSGAIDVQASKSGLVFDLSTVSGAQVTADSLTRLTVYGFLPSTAVVTVLDQRGAPISGASVALKDSKNVTVTLLSGADGKATFESLLKGVYTVTVTATGRGKAVTSLDIARAGDTAQATVTLDDPATLRVRVVDNSTSNPVSGAQVRVIGPDPATTDVSGSPKTSATSGEASFSLPQGGHYTVAVTKNGYTTYSSGTDVAGGANADFEARMSAAQGGSLRVFLVDLAGRPYVDKTVRIWSETGYPDVSMRTDLQGQILLTNLQPGRYYARATRNAQTTGEGIVTAGNEAIVTVVRR